jgi:hypothetical protein
MSKHFLFDSRSLDRMEQMALKIGLDGVAVTEHFHGVGFWTIYDHLQATHPYEYGLFWTGRLALIPGAEINIREGAHIIVLGDVSELRRLDRAFPTPLSHGYEPTLREFLDVTDDFDVVRVGAHMFRLGKELGKFTAADLRRLHALEVNGKDFGTEVMLLAQARALGLPIVAGSDAHHWLQLGVRHTLVHTDELTLRSVLKGVREGLTGFATRPYTPPRVKAAKTLKTITKMLRKYYGGRAVSAATSLGR